MSDRDNLGSQLALLAFVALTATSASTWYSRPAHESQPVGAIVRNSDPEAHLHGESSAAAPAPAPSPVLRPLALLANAIGSEPLFVLKTPGNPVLSQSFRPAATSGASSFGAPSSSAPTSVVPSSGARTSGGCANRRLANPVLLDSGEDVCGVVDAMRRKMGNLRVKMLIATLPDWVDSSLQWTFDPMLDAIQMSAAQMGYVLTGFDMTDSEPDPSTIQPKGSTWPYPRVHEMTPGSLLFRRPRNDSPSTDPDFLLILLVGETATAGVHSAALAAALDLATLWEMPARVDAAGAAHPPDSGSVGILGPAYSGSTFSLVQGLKEAAERHGLAKNGTERFDVVTGSASSPGNPQSFGSFGLASFRATTRSDPEELSAIAQFLGRRNPGWQCGNHMALLVEANTTWGRGVVESVKSDVKSCQLCKQNPPGSGETLLPCAAVVPFPLHISRLRGAALMPADAQTQNPASSMMSLDLSERLQPVDRIPPETPQLTAATVAIMVSGMFRAVQDRQITAIGILATDKRDHLYLAQEIARHRPNVLAFTLESSQVYVHPDVADYVRGTLVASTYSLSERTQRLTRPLLGQRLPQQFGSSPAHGVFNALAVLMHHPEQLIDYDAPAGLGGGESAETFDSPCRPLSDGRASGGCSPPVWISVVGHGELLPLDAQTTANCDGATGSAPGPGYALCLRPPSGSGKATAAAAAWESAAATPATACSADCGGRTPYLAPHDLFLLAVSLLWLAMIGYQVWLQRRIDLWRATGQSFGDSSLQDWMNAVAHLASHMARGTASGHPASAEFMASLAAIRGATLTLFLWWTKLALIYSADSFGLAASLIHWIFVAIAAAVSIFVVWQTVNAFWSIGGGSWHDLGANRVVITLVLALAVVASLGDASYLPLTSESIIIAFGLMLCGLSIFVHPSGSAGGATSTLARWRRLPALLALGAFIAFSFDLMCMNWNPVEALVYADRTASVGDLVSPAAPILLFSVAMFWWGAWNVRRLQLLYVPEGEVGIGLFLGDRARAAGIDPQFFRQPTLTLGVYIIVPTVAALVALAYGRRYVGTIDGRYFGEFLLLGAAAIATVMLHALAHTLHFGRAVVSLLRSLARHSGASMFQVLGKEPVRWRITFRESARQDLEILLRSIARLESTLDSWGPAEDRLLPQVRSLKSSLQSNCRSATERLSSHNPGDAMARPLDVSDWRVLDRLTRLLNAVLQRSLWSPHDRQPASAPLVRSLGEMEYIVYFHASLVLRDLLMRLVSGFTMVIGGMLMLVTAHLLYTFEGRVFWLIFDAGAVALAAAFSVRLLLTLERDSILSVLWGTTPGRISLFGGLTWRMMTYGVVSLATLFAVLFPELGGQILNWVAPARAVLSE